MHRIERGNYLVLGADDRMLSKTRKDDLVPGREMPRSVFRLERVTVQSYSASGHRDGDAQGFGRIVAAVPIGDQSRDRIVPGPPGPDHAALPVTFERGRQVSACQIKRGIPHPPFALTRMTSLSKGDEMDCAAVQYFS